MIIRCGLLLLLLSCARTSKNNFYENEVVGSNDLERIFSYSFWPSMHNGAKMMKLRKREVQDPKVMIEAGHPIENGSSPVPDQSSNKTPKNSMPKVDSLSGNGAIDKNQSIPSTQNVTGITNGVSNVVINAAGNTSDTVAMSPVTVNETNHNVTAAKSPPVDLNNPGVLMRALIVFGGFALMAGAYLIFYKRKGKNNDTSSTHGINDANQFRYGILQSDDRRDNLELSRVPLTMESDEDEDDDLEIFDLEQKKKSLSYVNLQTNDEDVVFSNSSGNTRENDRDNLLLDIEDASLDTLINWSNNGNKSIL